MEWVIYLFIISHVRPVSISIPCTHQDAEGDKNDNIADLSIEREYKAKTQAGN